MHSIDKNL